MLKAALDGAGLLFVGAGVGFLSTNRDGDPLPDADRLVSLLCERAEFTNKKFGLPHVSQLAARKLGRPAFLKYLSQLLEVKQVDDRLSNLYNLPWMRIYTTNYDNSIEVARRGTSVVSSLSLSDDPSTAGEGSIIHLNGSMESVSAEKLDEDLKLTDLSYVISDFLESDWAKQFRIDLRTCRSIVFVGYSLSDLDISKVLISTPALKEKTIFFISPEADEIEIFGVENFGSVVDGGVERLFESVNELKSQYTPTNFAPLTELREIRASNKLSIEPASRMLYDQLVFGKIPENAILLGEMPSVGIPYLVSRKQVRESFSKVKAGETRDIFIHGQIASGKTCAAFLLSSSLVAAGFLVFWVTKGPTLLRDLERAARLERDVVLVFENYGSFLDEIKYFCCRRKKNHHVILTARTMSHDLIQEVVERFEGVGPIHECQVDEIAGEDLSGFAKIVNFAGLWGDYTGLEMNELSGVIRKNFRSSLYLILIEIVRSKKVQDDLFRLLEPINFNKKALLIFTSAFVINALGFVFEVNQWQHFFRIDSIRSIVNRFSEQFRTFMTVEANSISPLSGLLSAQILKAFVSDADIVECLEVMYKGAVEAARYDPEMGDLRVELGRFGAIEPIFSEDNPYPRIMDYFDRIRSVGSTENDADYWLQCGIAATAYDDLGRAETAFDNAYKRERRKSVPRLRRIDNYYSRFEMKKAVQEKDPGKAFETFKSAHNRLIQQIFEDKNRHYPFKTSREFTGVAAHHFDRWESKVQDDFLDMVRDIRTRALSYRDQKGDVSADVNFLIRETSGLLAKLANEAIEHEKPATP